MKSKIKLLLYCGLMIMTLNAFALNIDTWSKPVEFHSNNFTNSPGEVWGYRLPIVVGGNKIIYVGYDRIEYSKQYDVSYRVCELDKNTGEQKLVKQTPTGDYNKIMQLIAQNQFIFWYQNIAIPNSNSFIDFLFLGNPDGTIKNIMYRTGTVHSDDSITWSELKELNLNFKNDVYCESVEIAITSNKNIVFVPTNGLKSHPRNIITGILKPNTFNGELEIESITEVENDSSTSGVVNVNNKYVAIFMEGGIKIGEFNKTGTINLGKLQNISNPYWKKIVIKNQLAIPNYDYSHLTLYNINSNLTISKDEASETMNLPSMCKNEYDWDVNWIEGEDKLLTTVYIYDDVNSTQSIYYSEANIVNKL